MSILGSKLNGPWVLAEDENWIGTKRVFDSYPQVKPGSWWIKRGACFVY